MADVDPETAALLEEDPTVEVPTVATHGRVGDAKCCPEEGCEWVPPPGDKRPLNLALGRHRLLEHGIRGVGPAGSRKVNEARAPKAKQAKAPRESSPRSIKVDLGQRRAGKDDPVLAAVEARAKQAAGVVAAILLVAGQPDDARDIEAGREQWAATVRELAAYEPWLRKLGEGTEASGRMIAWTQFSLATAALLLPITIRHGVIPDSIARFLEMADVVDPAAAVDDGAGGGVGDDPAAAVAA